MNTEFSETLIRNKAITESIVVGFSDSLLILGLSVLAGFYIRFIFKKYSNSYSSTSAFGNTLLMVTISVASLIAVVKSSLALSLGLVGALSVVRFRTAIKEPYNLAFVLLSICIGIAIGASQYLFAVLIAITGSVVAIYAFKINNKSKNSSSSSNFLDSISLTLSSTKDLPKLCSLLDKYTEVYSIKNLSSYSQDNLVLNISIHIDDHKNLNEILFKIREEFKDASITFYNRPES
ncbi:DUF4956 domain-containing protein [Prochlorococcus marinus XMU1406]|uniref:DUF4956 domain-containing protein n=1 Tax=Prochlorococcus marinus TaxID=1219 RepID=UPI001ADC8D69|nr:DUF4956 domain-containing protein [Prochlorococcus marinus]MBO8206807.1 DUF4956 domain-containing protein [Prochlorococcus marinus XMU1406]MCR8542626.1 DUF4956 domain-containing protein [Prochlorococcus marinus XMU1427]